MESSEIICFYISQLTSTSLQISRSNEQRTRENLKLFLGWTLLLSEILANLELCQRYCFVHGCDQTITLSSGTIEKLPSEGVEMYESIPKEDLVEMAVTFFSNPDVRKCPFSQQEEFLKKKGLTTEQIKTAYEKSFSHMINVPAVQNVETVKPVNFALRISWFHKLKDLFSVLAFLVGASYGFYYLYKRFVKPFLFGKPKKPKTIDSSINNLSQTVEKSISDLRVDVQIIQNELKKVVLMQSDQHSSIIQLTELKSEVAGLKGILLSRHEYANVNIPTIPTWQLCSDPRKSEKGDKEIIESEESEHHGGSCENECGANPNSNGGSQGSDSSLEMIKEVDA